MAKGKQPKFRIIFTNQRLENERHVCDTLIDFFIETEEELYEKYPPRTRVEKINASWLTLANLKGACITPKVPEF